MAASHASTPDVLQSEQVAHVGRALRPHDEWKEDQTIESDAGQLQLFLNRLVDEWTLP